MAARALAAQHVRIEQPRERSAGHRAQQPLAVQSIHDCKLEVTGRGE